MSLLVVPIGKGLNCSDFNSPLKEKTRRTKTWLPYNFFSTCADFLYWIWKARVKTRKAWPDVDRGKPQQLSVIKRAWPGIMYYIFVLLKDHQDRFRENGESETTLHACMLSDICTCRASFVRELMTIQFTFQSFKCWPPKNAYFFTNGHFYYTDILIIVWMKSCSVSCFSS